MRLKRRAQPPDKTAFVYGLVFRTLTAKIIAGALCMGLLLPSVEVYAATTTSEVLTEPSVETMSEKSESSLAEPDEPEVAEEIEPVVQNEPASEGNDRERAADLDLETIETSDASAETIAPDMQDDDTDEVADSPPTSTATQNDEPTENSDRTLVVPVTSTSSDVLSAEDNSSSDIAEDAATSTSGQVAGVASTSVQASTTTDTEQSSNTESSARSQSNDDSNSEVSIDTRADEVATSTTDVKSDPGKISSDESDDSSGIASSSLPENRPNTSVVYTGDQRVFNGTSCRATGDGGYYCLDTTNASETEYHTSQVVFAAPDKDGDMEIYVRTPDGLEKLTNNQVDDAAPRYDARSERIVWHRLLGERYQVLMFDTKTGETLQLSSDKTNNMQPAISGNHVLWQAWIDDNWEIVHYELGASTTQLTNSKAHNIAPAIRGEYALWQTQVGSDWQTTLYNLTTGEVETIAGRSGGSALNPRLVLMYEEYADNGDVTRLGYDLEAGEVITLATLPTEQPELPDIPEPQPEKAAIVHAVPTIKEQSGDDIDPTNGTSSSNSSTGSTTATSSLPLSSSSTIASSTIIIPAPSLNEDSETIAAPQIDSSATTTLNIPDLIIPKATSTESVVTEA